MTTDEAPSIMHPIYLPVTEDQLVDHFATTSTGLKADQRHLKYYKDSLERLTDFERKRGSHSKSERLKARANGLQLQKDERFWVAAALLTTYYRTDRTARFAELLRQAIGETPPFDGFSSWEDALTDHFEIYLEVNTPSPLTYREWLQPRLDERVLVPHLLESAKAAGLRLESATKVDAVLVAPETGVAVFFEGKVLSDVSATIKHDVMRNQLARTIDVTLDEHKKLAAPLNARAPARTCVVLLTPRIFQTHPYSRLYGWLMNEYRNDPASLARDLPHRERTEDLTAVSRRLGWLTFEDCREVTPEACGWLV